MVPIKDSTQNILFLLSFSLLVLNGCKKEQAIETKPEWVSLFNGQDLQGWKAKINGQALNADTLNTFRVVDGAMQVSYEAYDTFTNQYGHIFYEKPFSNYRLKMQYRFIGEQANGGQPWAKKNSGIMIHSQSGESMGLDQAFPVSIEVQFLGGVSPGEPRPTANLCTPGTHVIMSDSLVTTHCIPSSSETFYGEEWIDLELYVHADSLIRHLINGKEVMSYSKPVIGGEYNTMEDRTGEKVTSGYISLQSESHPIEFRNIMLLELDQ